MIRVLLADDSEGFRVVLKRFLEQHPSVEIVGEATTLKEAIESARRLQPDVVLLDLHMDGTADADPLYIKTGLLMHAERVLAMSVWNDEESKRLAVSYGAVKLLDKSQLAYELMPALSQVPLHQSPPKITSFPFAPKPIA
jgi:two-component system response regulator NreC